MTIYNKELTSKLESLFTDTVFSWTKNKIRNELENLVSKAHSLAVMDNNKIVREIAFEMFSNIKEIDDEFTELYTQELDYKL